MVLNFVAKDENGWEGSPQGALQGGKTRPWTCHTLVLLILGTFKSFSDCSNSFHIHKEY